MNISPVAKMSFAAVAFFMTSASINAGEISHAASAIEKLGQNALNIEETIRYRAPETTDTYFVSEMEINSAIEQLGSMSAGLEASVRYQAPEVSEDVEAYEVTVALENLESFLLAQEESIKF